MFWGRRYKMRLADPDAGSRQGVLLAVGASGGKKLFDGVNLTAHYFFDAISARFAESLTYKKVESAGAVASVPGVDQDIGQAVDRVMDAELNKPSLVFVSEKDACRSQIAAAYAKMAAQGSIRVLSAGIDPAGEIHGATRGFLADQGVDIKYRQPRALDDLMAEEFKERSPSQVICMTSDTATVPVQGAKTQFWDIDQAQKDTSIASLAEEIHDRVDALISDLQSRHQSG
jgi:protein-tyrosine-phosphatase